MDLSRLRAPAGSTKREKRVGRGRGSGHGKTSCRGQKGAGARQGGYIKIGFEGGQMPLARRLPKWGFVAPFSREYQVVNVGQLAGVKGAGDVDRDALVAAGLVRGKGGPIKLLAEGDVAKAYTVRVNRASKAAIAKIEAKGGKVDLIRDPWQSDEPPAEVQAPAAPAEDEK